MSITKLSKFSIGVLQELKKKTHFNEMLCLIKEDNSLKKGYNFGMVTTVLNMAAHIWLPEPAVSLIHYHLPTLENLKSSIQ